MLFLLVYNILCLGTFQRTYLPGSGQITDLALLTNKR